MSEILTSLLSQFFEGDGEAAAAMILDLADSKEREGADLYEVDRYNVMRDEIDSDFTKNVIRLTSHTSRELDKALARYWATKERLDGNEQESAGEVPPADAGSLGTANSGAGDSIDYASIEALLDDMLTPPEEGPNAKRTYGEHKGDE